MKYFAVTFLVLLFLLVAHSFKAKAHACMPSGLTTGKNSPEGECNDGYYSECCAVGQLYPTYTCSPPVYGATRAILTLKNFEDDGSGGKKPACDNQFHDNNTPIVTLSTGWFNRGSRCSRPTIVRGNGRRVIARVVGECDSRMGCDYEHAYKPPCRNNVIEGSIGVWRALGAVPEENGGELSVLWRDL